MGNHDVEATVAGSVFAILLGTLIETAIEESLRKMKEEKEET